jgi:dihydroflavonol-4-reductase
VGVETRVLDLPSVPSDALAGCDACIHAAAFHGLHLDDRARMESVNVEGTRAMLTAARAQGLRRFVHVSTMGTCAPRADRKPATEADVIQPGPLTSHYARTKLVAERLALAATDLDVVVVNPTALVGAGDTMPSVTGRRILDVLNGRRPRVHEGPVNHGDVDDVAESIVTALERGRSRERYLLGGKNLDEAAFLDLVCAAANIPRPAHPKQGVLARLLAPRRPIPGNLAVLDDKAVAELGHAHTPLAQSFQRAVMDFRARGLAP